MASSEKSCKSTSRLPHVPAGRPGAQLHHALSDYPRRGIFPDKAYGRITTRCAVAAPLPASLKIPKAPQDQAGSERETPWAVQDMLRFCC